jgi:hypothetical protein
VVKAVITGGQATVFTSSWATLDGTASEGCDPQFEWSVLSDDESESEVEPHAGGVARFRAARAGLYVVRLTVRSGDETDTAATLITIAPLEARVTGPASVTAYDSVELDGSRSTGPSDMLYHWTADGGRVEPANEAKVRFLADAPGTGRATLTVRPGDAPIDAPREQSATKEHVLRVDPSRGKGGSDEDTWWRDEQVTRNRQALADVRSTSAKWEASITGFLGVFAAVTFLAGPDALSDIGSPGLARLGLTVIGIAFLLAFVARVFVADVGNAIPSLGPTLTTPDYQKRSRVVAENGAAKLEDARWLAIAAALLVAAGSLATAWAALSGPAPAEPQALLRTPSGIICGTLTTDESGVVSIGGTEVGSSREVMLVDLCNAPSPAEAAMTPSNPTSGLLVTLGVLGAVVGAASAARRSLWLLLLGIMMILVLGWWWYVAIDGQRLTTDLNATWSIPATAFCGAAVGAAIILLRRRPKEPRADLRRT